MRYQNAQFQSGMHSKLHTNLLIELVIYIHIRVKPEFFAASIAQSAILAVWLLKQPSQIAYISEPKSDFTRAFYW